MLAHTMAGIKLWAFARDRAAPPNVSALGENGPAATRRKTGPYGPVGQPAFAAYANSKQPTPTAAGTGTDSRTTATRARSAAPRGRTDRGLI